VEELQENFEATYASVDSMQKPTSHGDVDRSEGLSPASENAAAPAQGFASSDMAVDSDGRGRRRGSSMTERGLSEDEGPSVRNDLMDLSTPRA
jgi:hypothetical protein